MMGRQPPEAPGWEVPQESHDSITLRLKLITPMFGGGYEPRQVDTIYPIRPAAIRGHLRFWWRALYGGQFSSAEKLLEEEAKLWGTMERKGQVDLKVSLNGAPVVQSDDIAMSAPDAYALWPARATRGDNPQPPAQRIKQGLSFQLTLSYPDDKTQVIHETMVAWILFGGIGGRTRRGCGSLTVEGSDAAKYLPSSPDKTQLLRFLPALKGTTAQQPIPVLSAAQLVVAEQVSEDALACWYEALSWLREFRQGSTYPKNERAREPDPTRGKRPSISNWPEADKVRHALGNPTRMRWAHPPRHNGTPAWPRAGFGLPIVGQFQQKDRTGRPWRERGLYEPRGFEIVWMDETGGEHERLASPLILKPLPLVNGQFVACALWLNRAYPTNGQPCLRGRADTAAPFEQIVAPDDKVFFDPLKDARTLQEAFFGWVSRQSKVRRLLP